MCLSALLWWCPGTHSSRLNSNEASCLLEHCTPQTNTLWNSPGLPKSFLGALQLNADDMQCAIVKPAWVNLEAYCCQIMCSTCCACDAPTSWHLSAMGMLQSHELLTSTWRMKLNSWRRGAPWVTSTWNQSSQFKEAQWLVACWSLAQRIRVCDEWKDTIAYIKIFIKYLSRFLKNQLWIRFSCTGSGSQVHGGIPAAETDIRVHSEINNLATNAWDPGGCSGVCMTVSLLALW